MYARVDRTTIVITISWTKPFCSIYVYEVSKYTSNEYCLIDGLKNIYQAMEYVKNNIPKWLKGCEIAIRGNKNTLYYVRHIPQKKKYSIRAKSTKNLFYDINFFDTKEAAENYLMYIFKDGIKNAKF